MLLFWFYKVHCIIQFINQAYNEVIEELPNLRFYFNFVFFLPIWFFFAVFLILSVFLGIY